MTLPGHQTGSGSCMSPIGMATVQFYLMAADGTAQSRLLKRPRSGEASPDWQPLPAG